MSKKEKLYNEYLEKVKKLEESCKHKSGDWVWWSADIRARSNVFRVKICELCGKYLTFCMKCDECGEWKNIEDPIYIYAKLSFLGSLFCSEECKNKFLARREVEIDKRLKEIKDTDCNCDNKCGCTNHGRILRDSLMLQ